MSEEENSQILKIDFILKSGYTVKTYSLARGFDVKFDAGKCSSYSLEIPEGLPVTHIACLEIAAVIVKVATVDEYGNVS